MTTTRSGRGRGRFAASVVLLAIAVLLGPLMVVAAWARTQIGDTGRYVRTMAPLARDLDVQAYVAQTIAEGIFERLDVQGWLEDALPGRMDDVQPAISAAVQGFLFEAASRFTESETLERLWDAANRAGHTVVAGVLTGDAPVTELRDGQLTLDLGETLRGFQSYLVERGFAAAGGLDLGGVERVVVLAEGAQLERIETARALVQRLDALAWVLFAALVAAAAGSVLVAPHRPRALTRLGGGLALAMVLVAMAEQPAFAQHWARPAQIGVAVLGLLGIVGRDAPPASSTVTVLVLTVGAVVSLEIVRRRRLTSDAAAEPAPPRPAAP